MSQVVERGLSLAQENELLRKDLVKLLATDFVNTCDESGEIRKQSSELVQVLGTQKEFEKAVVEVKQKA